MTDIPPAAVPPPVSAAQWNREPARLPAPHPPLDLADAHALLVRAAEPFRAGTRLRVPVVVAFATTEGVLRAPGALLPSGDDPDASRYLARVTDALPGRGWLLTVRNPLRLDFAHWATARAHLAALWRRVGWPVLPVTAELTAGHGLTRQAAHTPAPDAAVLTWVLHGRLTVHPAGREKLRAEPGELLHWPAGLRPAERHDEHCVTLRVTVPTAPRDTDALVRELLAQTAERAPAYADGLPPYLPAQPPADPGDPVPVAEPLGQLGELVTDLVHGPTVERALRSGWAARRSAAGLDPAPPPRPGVDLGDRAVVRGDEEVVRVPDGYGRTVWAAGGQAVSVGGSAAERILAALPPDRPVTANQVAEAAGAAGNPDPVRALLGTLYRLRAVELADDGAGGDHPTSADDRDDREDG